MSPQFGQRSLVCLPEGVPYGKYVLLVRKYLNQYWQKDPGLLDQPAGVSIYRVLLDEYMCPDIIQKAKEGKR